MTVFCTYCSADKDPAPGDLPAIQRYRSQRITAVHDAAESLGVPFLILSGEYGILQPCDPIPCYDHLLLPLEVSDLSARVAGQLVALGVRDLIFFARSFEEDRRLKPYWDCIELACQSAGIALTSVALPP